MSQHKGNHVKHTRYLGTLGETPGANLKGITAEAARIKDKFRSPFGFCGPRRSKGTKA